jgi:hypothetical protein
MPISHRGVPRPPEQGRVPSIELAARKRIVQAPALPPAQAAGACAVPPQSGRQHAPQCMAAAPSRAAARRFNRAQAQIPGTGHHTRGGRPRRGVLFQVPALRSTPFLLRLPTKQPAAYGFEWGCMSPNGLEVCRRALPGFPPRRCWACRCSCWSCARAGSSRGRRVRSLRAVCCCFFVSAAPRCVDCCAEEKRGREKRKREAAGSKESGAATRRRGPRIRSGKRLRARCAAPFTRSWRARTPRGHIEHAARPPK